MTFLYHDICEVHVALRFPHQTAMESQLFTDKTCQSADERIKSLEESTQIRQQCLNSVLKRSDTCQQEIAQLRNQCVQQQEQIHSLTRNSSRNGTKSTRAAEPCPNIPPCIPVQFKPKLQPEDKVLGQRWRGEDRAELVREGKH